MVTIEYYITIVRLLNMYKISTKNQHFRPFGLLARYKLVSYEKRRKD